MRIGAYKSSSFLEFTPLPEISSCSFDLLAPVEGREVHQDSLALLSGPDFLTQLDVLHSRWTGTATLTGTYDFTLHVRGIRPSELWISVYLVDYISAVPVGDLPCMRHILDAGFSLTDAAAERLFEQFRELLGIKDATR